MVNRRTRVLAAAAAGASALLAAPAAVAGPPAPPGELCADGNVFLIEYVASYPGATGDQDGTYERSVPILGGCASSWAHGDGQLSTAAIAAQCRMGIEARFGPYPIVLRFAEDYLLRNRADCISVMTGVSSGEIDPGAAPLFPQG